MENTRSNNQRRRLIPANQAERTAALPAGNMNFIVAAQTKVESLVLRQERMLSWLLAGHSGAAAFLVDTAHGAWRPVDGQTPRLQKFRRQMIHTAHRQTQALRARAQELMVRVLIQEWEKAFSLVRHFQADFRTLLVLLTFLLELTEPGDHPWPANRRWLGNMRELARIILARGLEAERHKDIFALSDHLEYNLAPWLKHLENELERCAPCGG